MTEGLGSLLASPTVAARQAAKAPAPVEDEA